jgi:hypothetical protein
MTIEFNGTNDDKKPILHLFGSDHLNYNYKRAFKTLSEIKPDCITLEQTINGAASLYHEFSKPIKKQMERHLKGELDAGDFAVGVHYARIKGTPIYFIDNDRGGEFYYANKVNLNSRKQFELLNPGRHSGKMPETPQDLYEYFTERNYNMGDAIIAINKKSNFQNMVHIGGERHYDIDHCIPLQNLAKIENTFNIRLVDITSPCPKERDFISSYCERPAQL